MKSKIIQIVRESPTHVNFKGGSYIAVPDETPGESAYDLWIDAGHLGTESDFLSSLVGPPGAAGEAQIPDLMDLTVVFENGLM